MGQCNTSYNLALFKTATCSSTESAASSGFGRRRRRHDVALIPITLNAPRYCPADVRNGKGHRLWIFPV